jgi:crotonobetaine/carnitine-CoA ligase
MFGDRDLAWLVEDRAARGADRSFLAWAPFDGAELRWTHREFGRDVVSLAVGLQRQGIEPGDRVALVLENNPYFLLFWSAITSIGGVAVCLNPRGSVDELSYYASHSGVVAAVISSASASSVSAAMPSLRWVCEVDDPADVATFSGDPSDFRRVRIGGAAAASIQYTSGTTARPKGVVWTHANCLWAGMVNASHQRLTIADSYLLHLPLFHTNALSYSFLGSLWAGNELIVMPRFSASRFWDISVRYGCTWTSVVSFCIRALQGRDDPGTHRYRGWANSYVVDEGSGPGGIGAMGWFGMTETLSHPICSTPGLSSPAGSMGRAAAEYRVAVVDEAGRSVINGDPGQLLINGIPGISLFAGYLDDEGATQSSFTTDGWFQTGDRVRVDEAGNFVFVERDKDVLKVGGENVGAPEIERVLLGSPDVREAAVVGRPDYMLGEVPVAFVVVSGNEAATLASMETRCKELLPPFKQPREIRIVQDLPRSTLDKVAKSVLRKILSDETSRVESL